MNELNTVAAMHDNALTLNENAASLLQAIRDMQKTLEAKYNAEHKEPFNGFGDEKTAETEAIEYLDCAYSHLSDAITDICDCIMFIGLSQ